MSDDKGMYHPLDNYWRNVSWDTGAGTFTPDGTYSWEIWFKSNGRISSDTTFYATNQTLFCDASIDQGSYATRGSNHFVEYDSSDQCIRLRLRNQGLTADIVESTAFGVGEVTADSWHHVALSVEYNGTDTSTVKLWIDGKSYLDQSYPGQIREPEKVLICTDNTANGGLHGWSDEVKMWHTALTNSDVQQLRKGSIVDDGSGNVQLSGGSNIGSLQWANLIAYFNTNGSSTGEALQSDSNYTTTVVGIGASSFYNPTAASEAPVISTSSTPAGFTVNWNVVSNAEGYILDVATDEAFTNLVAGLDSLNIGNTTSYTVSGITSGTYYCRIKAYTLPFEQSEYSNEVMVIQAPTGLTATDITSSGFTANWDATFGASTYTVTIYSDAAKQNLVVQHTDIAETSYAVTGLDRINHYFTVVAIDGDLVASEESEIMMVTPPFSSGSPLILNGSGHLYVGELTGQFNDQITITFWAKGDVALGNNWAFHGRSTTDTNLRISAHVPWTNGEVYFDGGNTSTNNRINTAIAPHGIAATEAWNHWAFIKNKTTGVMKIYANGREIVSGTGKTYAIDTLDNFLIGTDNANYDNPYLGEIDEFRVWNIAQTEAQVQAGMFTPPAPDATGLVLSYNFEDSTDDKELTDSSINGFNATIVGSVVTPAIGLVATQTENILEWSIEEEIGVKEYKIINATTGELIGTIMAGAGTYIYELPEGVTAKIIVVDNNGIETTEIPDNGNILATEYSLIPGWNLIAITGANADLAELKAATAGNLWGWNGSAYETATSPSACQGIWVYSEIAQQVTVSADKTQAEIVLESGWNLVGPTTTIRVPEVAHTVYSWNEVYEQVLKESGSLMEGVGYWIFSL